MKSRLLLFFLVAASVLTFGQSPNSTEYEEAIRQAKELMKQGDVESVVQKLTPWVERFPTSVELRHGLGLAHYQLDQFPAAIEHFEAVLSLESDETARRKQAVQFLGMAYYFEDRWERAIPLLEKVITWGLSDTDLLHALATCHLNVHDLRRSRLAYAKLFGIEPESPQAFLLTAHFMYQGAYARDAEEILRETIARWPEWKDYSYELGAIAITARDYKAVAQHLTKELDRNPSNSSAWHYLGEAYLQLAELDKAKAALERAIWLDDRSAKSFGLLAEVYLAQDRLAEAENVLELALKIEPKNYLANFLLARVYSRTNRPDRAQEQMKLANELRGN